MKKVLYLLLCYLLIAPNNISADEGMWLPMLIDRLNMKKMKEMGLQLSAEEIYSVNKSSLKDAIVSFNGYCTGEIISKNGLLLTNHHCGYDAIQNLSSLENDYLGNGFWAKSHKEELVNDGLFVDFLIKMKDVSSEVLDSIDYTTAEDVRSQLITKRIGEIKERETKETNYWSEVKSFFGGSEYYLFIYERYTDIRLVGTPPESIGKFGGDTDNWMWPRHTGDFALFRVYTAPDGSPADYHKDNIPLSPKHHLPISLDGVQQDDFTMILGYPGGTDRYLSSFGVKLAVDLYNPTVVKLREAKLNILNEYMRSDRNISLMYASKKARISNYWKYYIGQTRGLKKLNIYNKKIDIEKQFQNFVNLNNSNKEIYGNVLSDIELGYKELQKTTLSRIYLNEAAWGGPSFVQLARRSEKLLSALKTKNDSSINAAISVFRDVAESNFKEYKKEIDQDIFAKMMEMYFNGVPQDQLPEIISKMSKKYKKDFKKWGDVLYKKSIFVDRDKMIDFLQKPTISGIEKDPAYLVQKSILDNYFTKIRPANSSARSSLNIANRLFIDGLRKMDDKTVFYPNANFTMRLTYGTVGDYIPANAIKYNFSTTLGGVIEKMDNDNPEFIVPKKLVELYHQKDYGPYADSDGNLNVCFISNNDITGGNSGSPVINNKGHLIGCAFDGNWEAMSGDIAFEDKLQRTISVDVRYILFIIEKFAGARNIIEELTLVKMSDEERALMEQDETLRVVESIKSLIDDFPEIIQEKCAEIQSYSNKSFSEAFSTAKKNNLTLFEWQGKKYTTGIQSLSE